MNGRLLDECGEPNGFKLRDSDSWSIRNSTAGPVHICLTWKVKFCCKGENKKRQFHKNRLTNENRNQRAYGKKKECACEQTLEGTSFYCFESSLQSLFSSENTFKHCYIIFNHCFFPVVAVESNSVFISGQN